MQSLTVIEIVDASVLEIVSMSNLNVADQLQRARHCQSRRRHRVHWILYLPPFEAEMDIDIDLQRRSVCVFLCRRLHSNPSRDPLGATVGAMAQSNGGESANSIG